MEIKGTTRIVGLLGHPVQHTFSPAMHNAAFEALGLDFVYLPFDVAPTDLKEAVRSLIPLGIVGVNVTIPHKEKVIPLLDEVSAEAELIGSVNTIAVADRRLVGYNTDAYGFLTSLEEDLGMDLASKRMFVMGAGGASRAVCFQAALSGAQEIVIGDVEADRAEALCRDISGKFPAVRVETCSVESAGIQRALADKDLMVNATPVGMKPHDPQLIRPDWLSPGAGVFDLIYNPGETRLLREARQRGHSAVNGIGMLVHQGARAFEIFTGRRPDVQVMLRVLKQRFSE